jgi:hypothetical protein
MFFSGEMIAEIVRHILRPGKKKHLHLRQEKRFHLRQAQTLQLTNTTPQDENHIFFGL